MDLVRGQRIKVSWDWQSSKALSQAMNRMTFMGAVSSIQHLPGSFKKSRRKLALAF